MSRKLGLGLASLMCAFMCGIPMIASAQAALSRISVDLVDMDLLQASQILMKKSGAQIVIAPSDQPYKRITLHLSDLPAEDAVRYLCEAAGASYTRDENGVFVLSHKTSTGSNELPPRAPAGPILKKRVRVMKADPKSIYDAVMYKASQDPNLHWSALDAFRKSHNPSSQAAFGDGNVPFDVTMAPPISATSNPSITLGGIELPGGDSAPLAQLGGFGQGGGPAGGGGIGQGGAGQGGSPTLAGGQGLVPAGISFISYDPTDNSFIVEGTDEAIQQFIRLVNEFDEAPRQVVVKVEFVTTSSSVTRSLGFEFQYSRGAVNAGSTPGSNVRAGDPVFLNMGSGNVVGRMRTQLQEGFGKVVNSPSVRTLNNQPAAFFTSVQTTIFINEVVGNGNGSVIVTSQPFPITISTGLVVSPRINGDGTVTMNLTPQIQDFGQLRRGPDGQEIPDILSQAINVVARVKNNETVVIGGLTRNAGTGSESRTPVLSDLPLAGQFFRSRTSDKDNSELLIFVTPHIVDEEEGSGGG